MTPDDGGNWGILGGTFDPVHCGHINLAVQVAARISLDGVLLVPSYNHPFKNRCSASFEHRMAMLELSTQENEKLVVSDIEKSQSLTGYTIDSIKTVKKRYPNAVWSFIIGEDNVKDLRFWRDPDRIMKEVCVLVGYRPPHDSENILRDLPSDRIRMIEIEMRDISSTKIRKLLRSDRSDLRLKEMIPVKALKYIKENGLYR